MSSPGLFERSNSSEIKGNVLWAQGKAFKLASRERGDADWEASIAMYEQLLSSYPGAPLSQDAALDLFPIYQGELQAAMSAWLSELEEAQANGAAPSEWPVCPLEPHRDRMAPLAKTGILQAAQWVNDFYPRYLGSRKKGLGPSLWTLSAQFTYFQGTLQGPWIELSSRLRILCVRHFAGADWLQAELEKLTNEVYVRPYREAAQGAFYKVVGEVAKTDLERSAACFATALLSDREGDFANLEAALRGYRELQRLYPQSPWSDETATLASTLEAAMPGAPFHFTARGPHGETVDLADYRGKTLLVDFFTFNSEACDEQLRRIAELRARLDGERFAVVGVCHDSLVKASFDMRAEEHGITWTCASNLPLRRRLSAEWHVSRFPTAFVVDGNGVLRARSLGWAETVAEIEAQLGLK